MTLRWTVCGILITSAAMAQADKIEQVVQLNRAVPAYQQRAEHNFAAFEAGLGTHCAEITYDWSAAHARLLRLGTLLPDGHADGTQWEEAVPGRACGEPRRYRVLVVLHDLQAQMLPMLPGDGWAGPLLQHDTMPQVAASAAIYTHKTCAVDVVDTHIISGHPLENPKAVWTELWTVHSCGKHFGVPVTFSPDAVGSGTSMSVRNKDIEPLP